MRRDLRISEGTLSATRLPAVASKYALSCLAPKRAPRDFVSFLPTTSNSCVKVFDGARDRGGHSRRGGIADGRQVLADLERTPVDVVLLARRPHAANDRPRGSRALNPNSATGLFGANYLDDPGYCSRQRVAEPKVSSLRTSLWKSCLRRSGRSRCANWFQPALTSQLARSHSIVAAMAKSLVSVKR